MSGFATQCHWFSLCKHEWLFVCMILAGYYEHITVYGFRKHIRNVSVKLYIWWKCTITYFVTQLSMVVRAQQAHAGFPFEIDVDHLFAGVMTCQVPAKILYQCVRSHSSQVIAWLEWSQISSLQYCSLILQRQMRQISEIKTHTRTHILWIVLCWIVMCLFTFAFYDED